MDLEALKTKIESLSKIHQIEILKILHKHNVILNENKNGIYINMSFIESNVIEEIKSYLSYINVQEDALQTVESQKEEFKSAFFENI